MQRVITGFEQDEHGDWMARLNCGHTRHVRHNPPWQVRDWVTSEAGRRSFLGTAMKCQPCEEEAAATLFFNEQE